MVGIAIDSDLRRMYEVPDVAHSVAVISGGYRRYTPTVTAPDITVSDLLADIYSPYVRDRSANNSDYAPLAFRRSGGAVTDEDNGTNAATDLFMRNDYGWRFVAANYPHEWNIRGNLRRQNRALQIFDFSPLSSLGAYPMIDRAADLLVHTVSGASPLSATEKLQLAAASTGTPENVRAEIDANSSRLDATISSRATPAEVTTALGSLQIDADIDLQKAMKVLVGAMVRAGVYPVEPGPWSARGADGEVVASGTIAEDGTRTGVIAP